MNTKAAGKAAIHCASVSGNMTILNCLLEFNANLEVEVISVSVSCDYHMTSYIVEYRMKMVTGPYTCVLMGTIMSVCVCSVIIIILQR